MSQERRKAVQGFTNGELDLDFHSKAAISVNSRPPPCTPCLTNALQLWVRRSRDRIWSGESRAEGSPSEEYPVSPSNSLEPTRYVMPGCPWQIGCGAPTLLKIRSERAAAQALMDVLGASGFGNDASGKSVSPFVLFLLLALFGRLYFGRVHMASTS